MIVISRHKGEANTIGDILLSVMDFGGNEVTYGLIFPISVPIVFSPPEAGEDEADSKAAEETEAAPEEYKPLGDYITQLPYTMPEDDAGMEAIVAEMPGYQFRKVMRCREEALFLGNDREIVITVVDVRTDKVRNGLDAPIDIRIHRLEVHKAIAR